MIESRASALDKPSGAPVRAEAEPVQVEVDLEALGEWLLAGVRLFVREGVPSRQAAGDAAQRVVMVAALRHKGSISGAASVLGTSRRALRDAMKRLGIYERWQADGRPAIGAGVSRVPARRVEPCSGRPGEPVPQRCAPRSDPAPGLPDAPHRRA